MAKYITPAVTPLHQDGTLDVQGMEKLYQHLIEGGVSGILVLGSIGEFFALPQTLKKQLIVEAARIIDHRVPLLVGISSMVLEEAGELADCAFAAGADAVISVPPYYFWFQQPEIETYFDALAERVKGPLYLYNFPDRTGYGIAPETVLKLARKHSNIVGIKDTIGGVDHTREIIKLVKAEFPQFEVFSGFDDNFAHNVLCGGDGCIAGLSNLAPQVTSAWCRAVNEGDWAASAAYQKKIDRMMAIYSVGSPFVPFIKEALIMAGIAIDNGVTFPLPAATDAQKAQLKAILEQEQLI